jgi:uncharacterized protein (TIGR02145 family)
MNRTILSCLMILSVIVIGTFLLSVTGYTTGDNDNDDQMTKATVIDMDGNVYHTVVIGTQLWMVENLKVTHYRDGSPIPNISDDGAWSHLKTGAYCWYNNDSANRNKGYGALYNFYAVDDRRGLCPESWHVPTRSEWLALEAYLGGGSVAGGKMKEVRSVLWNSPNISATNESGFSGLPAGGRGRNGSFGDAGDYTTWWSSTLYDSTYAWHWGLFRGNARVRSNPGHQASGFSVRCVKDQ